MVFYFLPMFLSQILFFTFSLLPSFLFKCCPSLEVLLRFAFTMLLLFKLHSSSKFFLVPLSSKFVLLATSSVLLLFLLSAVLLFLSIPIHL